MKSKCNISVPIYIPRSFQGHTHKLRNALEPLFQEINYSISLYGKAHCMEPPAREGHTKLIFFTDYVIAFSL